MKYIHSIIVLLSLFCIAEGRVFSMEIATLSWEDEYGNKDPVFGYVRKNGFWVKKCFLIDDDCNQLHDQQVQAASVQKRPRNETQEQLDEEPSKRQKMYAFECPVCNQGFPQGKLDMHLKLVHDMKLTFICALCGMGFASDKGRTHHERVIHEKGDCEEKCPVDGCSRKGFTAQYAVDIHVRNDHPGVKPYVCGFMLSDGTLCHSCFASKNAHNRHIKAYHKDISG